MEQQKLFKSEAGREQIMALYEQKLAGLNIVYDEIRVETSFGETHIIVSGDANNPPLLLIHGSNGSAPIALETYPNLTEKYQVFAIDVLAQPTKSAENRLSMKDLSYGEWINEVLFLLDLREVTLAGFSFGGLIILKTLLFDEQRIRASYIAAPAFIVNGNPIKALLKVFIPMKRYMRTLKRKHVEKFLAALFTQRDEFAVQYLSRVFVHFKMDFTPVPVIREAEASQIKTPITLFAAGRDLMFPGRKMIRRARKIFPSLKKALLFPESRHVQNRADNTTIEQLILKQA